MRGVSKLLVIALSLGQLQYGPGFNRAPGVSKQVGCPRLMQLCVGSPLDTNSVLLKHECSSLIRLQQERCLYAYKAKRNLYNCRYDTSNISLNNLKLRHGRYLTQFWITTDVCWRF